MSGYLNNVYLRIACLFVNINLSSDRELAMLRAKAALIDISGTLHVGDLAIAGAPSALEKLRAAGVAVRFVTNSSQVGSLRAMGFQLDESEVWTASRATSSYLAGRGLRPFMLLNEDAKADFADVDVREPHNAVLVGLSKSSFNYECLNRAFRLLLQGAELVAIHRSPYFAEDDGLSLGPGAFIAGLEHASGTTCTVIGKPEPAFFHSVLALLGCTASETVMIGDDVVNDVQGALRAGLQAVLVRTGKYRAGDECKHADASPTLVANSFVGAVSWILGEGD